jgi:5'-nucleotidase
LRAPVKPQWVSPLVLDEVEGRLVEVLRGLDGGIDVIVAGHTHKLNNVLVPLRDGKLTLVTQAVGSGAALSLIDLTIDRPTGAVISKSARIASAWSDSGAGLEPNKKVAKIVAEAAKATAATVARPVGGAAAPMVRAETPSGESPLGDFVADAQRAAAGTDFAFVNAGGLRSDIPAGPITFGTIYAVEPFGNEVMRLTLSGAQVLALLEQQWSGAHAASPRFLRPSGLRYVFDLRRAPGRRIVAAWDADNKPLDPARRYTVAANDFLVGGGDFYPVLGEATDATGVMTDIAALEAWIHHAPGPVTAKADGRMERIDTPNY